MTPSVRSTTSRASPLVKTPFCTSITMRSASAYVGTNAHCIAASIARSAKGSFVILFPIGRVAAPMMEGARGAVHRLVRPTPAGRGSA